MYRSLTPGQLGDLGISLKPPALVANLVKQAVASLRVKVNTPVGPVTFNPSNPSDVAALKNAAKSVSIVSAPSGPSAFDEFNQGVQNIPGGWLTVAAGLGIAAMMFAKARR